MPAKTQDETNLVYANILEEVKLRVSAIDHCTLGRSDLAPPFVKDFCYLQIRMICELIAMGCLVVHGDIKQSSDMQKEYKADRIMSELEKLHPHFYPRAIKPRITPADIHIEPIPSPLPKADFLDMYRRCGDSLHRGNIKKLLKGQIPTQINYPEITSKAQRIVDLLSHHAIFTRGGTTIIIALLANRDNNNRVQVASAQTLTGQPAVDFSSPEFLRAWDQDAKSPRQKDRGRKG